MLEVRRLGKTFGPGNALFEAVDLDVARGEWVAIVGESGSGKSTLLNIVAGLDQPDRGEVRLDGKPLDFGDDDALALWRRRHVGFVFQSFHLLAYLSVRENVALPLALIGIHGSEREQRAQDALQAVGLGSLRAPPPGSLSRGEMQPAAIALGVALAGAVHTVHTSALAEIDRAAHALAGKADVEIRGPRSGFDDALFARIASRPEVLAASPVVEIEAALANGADRLRILGIDALRAVRLQPAFVVDAAKTGAGSVERLFDERAIWLSPAAAATLKAREGDALTLLSGSEARALRVAGILAGMQAGGELGVMDIAAAQSLFARVGSISRIDLRLRPGVDLARFRADIAGLLPPGVVASAAASLSGRAAAISRAYRVNLDALALVALATGAFLVFSTLALQAARRRQELPLLRALGVTRRGLALILTLEGALIGAVGAAIGTALGLYASRFLLERVGGDLGAGFFSAARSAFTPDVAALACIAALGIGMSIAGALWVARAVGRIEVAEALRDRAVDLPRPSATGGKLAVLLVAAGIPLLFLEPIAGLALGGYR